jgi:multiple sugar transport system substrate-binding protein
MLRNKHLTVLLSIVLVLSFIVSGCTAPAAQPAAAPAAAQPTAAPAAGQPTAALGAAQPTAGPAAAQPAAGSFDWKKYSGTSIKLLLNKHSYSEALVAELPKFEALTGIKVTYDIFPEENYFDKVTIDLSGGQGGYDAFMTGAYMIWQYAPAKWMEPLEPYINDPTKTNPDYNFNDILAWLRDSERWNLKPGTGNLGQGSQYALPWGFETNAIMYRSDIFEKDGLKPPTTLDELVATAKKLKELHPDMSGIMVRGSRNWATIHPGYMTMYSSYGCKDYDEKMHPVMNSACAIEVTKKWIDMIKTAGPQAWPTYTWYQVGSDFGAGKTAMIFDADILGYFQNVPGGSSVSGKIAWAPGPKGPDGKLATNIWIWSMAMNAASKQKDATWYFLQWATGKDFLTTGAVKYNLVDPVRQSIWDNADFKARMGQAKNYLETFAAISKGDAKIQFTPQPLFFETTTEWAATLQDIYAGTVTVEDGLNKLVDKLTVMLKQAGIYQP